MPGPKGAFKSVGKKLKKVFSKKRGRNRRARRQAGLPGGPGGANPPVPQVQPPQQQGPQGWIGGERRGERGGPQIGQNRDAPRGWVGGERQGERGGNRIGRNRTTRGWVGGERQGERGGLQIGQRAPKQRNEPEVETQDTTAPEPKVETQNSPQVNPYSNPYSVEKSEEKGQNPYEKPSNPYEKPFNPYEKPFNPDEVGSDVGSGSGSGSGDTYSTPVSDEVSEEAPKQVGEKKGEVSPYKSTPVESDGSEEPEKAKKEEGPYSHLKKGQNEGETKVKSPYKAFNPEKASSGSLSTSSSISAKEEVKDKPQELSPALKLQRDREIEMRVRKAQRKLKKDAEKNKPAPQKKFELGPYENDKTEGDTQNGEKSNSDISISTSVSEINTSKYELPPEELMLITAEVERELGIAALDVQAKFDGDKLPESVQLMMRKMRDHSKHTVDAPEVCRGQKIEITRGEKTHNEKMSKGWATTAMRSSYVNSDSKKGEGGSFNTKYFFDETTDLEQAGVKVLGSQQEKGREKHVIKFKDNKWVDAENKDVDTSQAGELQYAITMRQQKLKEKLEQAEQQTLGVQDKALIKSLNERITKLTEKLKPENLNSHKSVTGKFIYVMNSAGEFFAAKHVQFVLHHSSFLAGGAVATAGEIGISGGKLDYISNQSGHYRPGPAYLWQAVKQLELLGCPLDSVQVHVMTAKGKFKNAKDFLKAMDPTSDPKLFDSVYAIQHLDGVLAGLKSKKDVA